MILSTVLLINIHILHNPHQSIGTWEFCKSDDTIRIKIINNGLVILSFIQPHEKIMLQHGLWIKDINNPERIYIIITTPIKREDLTCFFDITSQNVGVLYYGDNNTLHETMHRI